MRTVLCTRGTRVREEVGLWLAVGVWVVIALCYPVNHDTPVALQHKRACRHISLWRMWLSLYRNHFWCLWFIFFLFLVLVVSTFFHSFISLFLPLLPFFINSFLFYFSPACFYLFFFFILLLYQILYRWTLIMFFFRLDFLYHPYFSSFYKMSFYLSLNRSRHFFILTECMIRCS